GAVTVAGGRIAVLTRRANVAGKAVTRPVALRRSSAVAGRLIAVLAVDAGGPGSAHARILIDAVDANPAVLAAIPPPLVVVDVVVLSRDTGRARARVGVDAIRAGAAVLTGI